MAIKDFLGIEFQVISGDVNTSGEDKAGYYPTPNEVALILRQIPHEPGNEEADSEFIVKADVIRGRKSWNGAESFEDAHFYIVSDSMLVSDPIDAGFNDLFFTEVFILRSATKAEEKDYKAKKIMDHKLLWSDGDFGSWRCIGG